MHNITLPDLQKLSHAKMSVLERGLSKGYWAQGVRPKALSQINNRELAEIVSYCLAPKHERPRARHLLKHPYFDSIRNEKLSVKLGQEALGVKDAGQQTPELSANGSAHGPANGSSPGGTHTSTSSPLNRATI